LFIKLKKSLAHCLTSLAIYELLHYINLLFDEYQKLSKERKEAERQESTWIEIVLPVTPSIGDEIEIPFISETSMNYRGYVHGVSHRINGTTQEIHIEVHPYCHYYYKWMKMKEENAQLGRHVT